MICTLGHILLKHEYGSGLGSGRASLWYSFFLLYLLLCGYEFSTGKEGCILRTKSKNSPVSEVEIIEMLEIHSFQLCSIFTFIK